MNCFVKKIINVDEINEEALRLKNVFINSSFDIQNVFEICQRWSDAILHSSANDIPGSVYLIQWLKRSSLESLVQKETGPHSSFESWDPSGCSFTRYFPLGLVGHWPAGNIEINPILSLVCSLLGGNVALVRVPTDLVNVMDRYLEVLVDCDQHHYLWNRFALISFSHEQTDYQNTMAQTVDGAMIWGSEDAVLAVRNLPFRHDVNLQIFGPQISIAFMDKESWTDNQRRDEWCLRLVREVWQFEQQACSSPQILFIEKSADQSIEKFTNTLARHFKTENKLHPRDTISEFLTSRIVKARAESLLENENQGAIFPTTPDWTILIHLELELPKVIQGRTLYVIPVESLELCIPILDSDIQTIGLAIADEARERKIVQEAGRRGVKRFVRLGMMHVFDTPWDGSNLVTSMMRKINYIPSQKFEAGII